MAMIKDSTGKGFGARVSSENRLQTDAITRPLAQHVNSLYEKQFSLSFDAIDPVGADDYFFYLENTGIRNLHITKFRLRSTVAGSVELHRVTGTPSYAASADVPQVNRHLGSSKSVTATIKTDTNTTGLTEAGVLRRIRLAVVDTDYVEEEPSHIIIPPGQKFALLWDAATGALTGTIDMYEQQSV